MQFETARNKPIAARGTVNRQGQTAQSLQRPTPSVGTNRPPSMVQQSRPPSKGNTGIAQPSRPPLTTNQQSAAMSNSRQGTPASQSKDPVQGWPAQREAIKKLKRQIINSLTRRFGSSLPPQVLQQVIRQVIKARLAAKRQQMSTPVSAPKQ